MFSGVILLWTPLISSFSRPTSSHPFTELLVFYKNNCRHREEVFLPYMMSTSFLLCPWLRNDDSLCPFFLFSQRIFSDCDDFALGMLASFFSVVHVPPFLFLFFASPEMILYGSKSQRMIGFVFQGSKRSSFG